MPELLPAWTPLPVLLTSVYSIITALSTTMRICCKNKTPHRYAVRSLLLVEARGVEQVNLFCKEERWLLK